MDLITSSSALPSSPSPQPSKKLGPSQSRPLYVSGFTDSTPIGPELRASGIESNLQLSQMRADSVRMDRRRPHRRAGSGRQVDRQIATTNPRLQDDESRMGINRNHDRIALGAESNVRIPLPISAGIPVKHRFQDSAAGGDSIPETNPHRPRRLRRTLTERTRQHFPNRRLSGCSHHHPRRLIQQRSVSPPHQMFQFADMRRHSRCCHRGFPCPAGAQDFLMGVHDMHPVPK
jgi:hypothetical protein